MRIIQINTTYGSSDSTGRTSMEMHHWLMQNKLETSVYCTSINDKNHDKDVYLFSNILDRKIHSLFSRITGLQGYFSIFSTKKLLIEIQKKKPDVVILRVLHSNCICLPMLFKYLKSNHILTILVLHDCWYFTGHCTYNTEHQCNKWITGCHNCRAIHADNPSWFFDTSRKCYEDKRMFYKFISHLSIIGVSDWIANEAKNSILSPYRIDRIYNWIDLKTFRIQDQEKARQKYGYQLDEKIAVCVASKWNQNKGIETVLEVAKNISWIKIILIGKWNHESIPSNIIPISVVDNKETLSDYYSISDIFLNPSRQETFGKTTAEALSCGIPVIAYNNTACKELITEECGVLVEHNNINAFIKAIIHILSNDLETYKNNCRKRAELLFDINKNMNAYMKLIHEMKE